MEQAREWPDVLPGAGTGESCHTWTLRLHSAPCRGVRLPVFFVDTGLESESGFLLIALCAGGGPVGGNTRRNRTPIRECCHRGTG